jgi:uncharacterized protein
VGLFLVTFLVMSLAILAMSIGVLNGRKEIQGSCGGLSADGKCTFCAGDVSECKDRKQDA